MLPEANQKLAVRLICGPIGGSGWYLGLNGSVYLISAHHIFYERFRDTYVSYSDVCEVHGFSSSESGFNNGYKLEIDLKGMADEGYFRRHPDRDLVAIYLGRVVPQGLQFLSLVKNVRAVNFRPIIAPNEALRLFEQVEVSNDAFLTGYPISVGSEDQLDATRPMVTKGIISSKNGTNSRIVLSAPSFPGNSGGPASELRLSLNDGALKANHAIIGTVTEYVPWNNSQGIVSNSGYSILEPVEAALEVANLIEVQVQRDLASGT